MGRTKPASIRFDPEKLELVKRKEKLATPQKVVDFLMQYYWWQNKLIVAPAMNVGADTLPYVAPERPGTAIEAYEQKIKNAMSAAEIEQIAKLWDIDPFVNKSQRESLSAQANKKVESLQ